MDLDQLDLNPRIMAAVRKGRSAGSACACTCE